MGEFMISFPTYSEAAYAYDLLNSNYIPSNIIRTPASVNHSCGYSLKIDDRNRQSAEYVFGKYNGYGSYNDSRYNF